MKKNNKFVLIILSIALIFLFEIVLYYALVVGEKKKVNISVIVYEDDKSWADLKNGAELAADIEENAEINFVVLPEDTKASEQKEAILNEISSGANYVITAAIDSFELSKQLNGVYEGKIKFIVNGTNDNNYKMISVDNYEMGYSLGKLINTEEGNDIKIGIVSTDDRKISLSESTDGIVDAMIENKNRYELWKNASSNVELYEFLKGQISKDAVDAIVVLSENALDDVVGAIEECNSSIPVYAIGHSEKAVYYLDSKQLKYLVYPDEFGTGYASVMNVLHPEKYLFKNVKGMITYKIVNREDMYTGEYEKVLFPFVK